MKLLIYRGNALHSEYELQGQTVRIGRSPQNDIILEDPGKGVSRQHAEIRVEGGHYMLVDLESQNGIWVDGSRVPSVQLAPGLTAALGPFRLTTVEVAAAAAPAPAAGEFVTEPTEYSRPEEHAGSEPIEGAGGLLEGSGSVPVPPPPPSPIPAPAAGGTGTMRAAGNPSGSRSSAALLGIAAAVIVLVGVSAFATLTWLHKRAPKPVWDHDAAAALVNDGKCAEAMQEQITPALNANPNDADALALKERCAPPPAPVAPAAPAPPPAPVEKTVAQKLDDVEASIAANQCQAALDAVNAVLTDNPDDARAKDLAAKADACLKPVTPATPEGPPPAVKIAAAQGGLDVQSGETQREYTRRIAAMKKRYEDAVALLQGQKYQQAVKELDAIASVVPAGYMDLAQRRADARTGIKDEAARVYATGKQAEQQADFNTALQRFQHAHDMDASIDITADVARLNDQKLKLGHQACQSGDANFVLGHNQDAAVQYQRVLDLVPESDACYAKARQRLAQIKR